MADRGRWVKRFSGQVGDMAIDGLFATFGRIFRQRCFYLFVSLIVLVVAVPFVVDIRGGKMLLQVAQALVLVSTVAAVGGSAARFAVALAIGREAAKSRLWFIAAGRLEARVIRVLQIVLDDARSSWARA